MVVASVALVGFVTAGSSAGVIGSVLSPLMKEFRWSNSLASSLASAYSLGVLLTTPAVGMALDKFGARVVMICGTAAASAGLAVASHGHSWSVLWAAFALLGIGISGSFYLPAAVVVTHWMPARRSLGMGIVMSSMSAGAALFAPLVGWWIELYGWRWTLEGAAMLNALLLPLILLIVRTHPPGEMQPQAAAQSDPLARSTRKELRSALFLLSTAGGVLFSLGMQGIYFQVVPLLIGAGYSPHVAGSAFGATWLLSGLGSLVLGLTADRFDTRWVLASSLLSCAFGTIFLLGVDGTGRGDFCVLVFVLLWGTSTNAFGQLAPVIVAERFGSGALGRLIGLQFTLAGMAGVGAPIITGWLVDQSGGSRLAIELSALAVFMGFVMIGLIRTSKGTAAESTARAYTT
jgi:MFS family permease